MSEPPDVIDFGKARRERLMDEDSGETTIENLLGIVSDLLEQTPDYEKAVFVMEKPEGGVTLLSAQTTIAEAVYLLEAAKQVILDPDGEDDDVGT